MRNERTTEDRAFELIDREEQFKEEWNSLPEVGRTSLLKKLNGEKIPIFSELGAARLARAISGDGHDCKGGGHCQGKNG
jgi:hypothetical protein